MIFAAAVLILGKVWFVIDPFAVGAIYLNAVTVGIGLSITFVMFNTNRNQYRGPDRGRADAASTALFQQAITWRQSWPGGRDAASDAFSAHGGLQRGAAGPAGRDHRHDQCAAGLGAGGGDPL